MHERFGATNPRAQALRFHTQTAGSTLTAQQPDNNIVRVALQALAAVLGGTQSLHCNGRDEALALPTEDSATIALRTQQIIAAESGVANTVDPAGGAYAIETLTNGIEREAREILARIDRAGGTLAAIESGLIQREVQEAAFRAQQAIDAGQTVVVGVNRFEEPGSKKGSGVFFREPLEKDSRPLFRLDPDVERRQIARVQALRAGRDAERHRAALRTVADAAAGGRNLVMPIVEAVEARATVGEIADTMRSVFGEFDESR
jgi:methylmalonyl-CoA mutase N-terminal domain/subunit